MQCLRQIKVSPDTNTTQLCLFDGIRLFDPKVLNNIIFSVIRYDKYYIITTKDTVYFIYQKNTTNTTYLCENIIIHEDDALFYDYNEKLLFKNKEYIFLMTIAAFLFLFTLVYYILSYIK